MVFNAVGTASSCPSRKKEQDRPVGSREEIKNKKERPEDIL